MDRDNLQVALFILACKRGSFINGTYKFKFCEFGELLVLFCHIQIVLTGVKI